MKNRETAFELSVRQSMQTFVQAIATDLDGTILEHASETISPRILSAFTNAHSTGIKIIIATGRPPRLVRHIIKQLISKIDPEKYANNPFYIICGNGSMVFDPHLNSVTKHYPIPASSFYNIITALRSSIDSLVFGTECQLSTCCENNWPDLTNAMDESTTYVDDIRDLVKDRIEVNKLMVLCTESNSWDLIKRVNDVLDPDVKNSVSITVSNKYFIEITASGITKGSCLKELCDTLEISQADVVTFGDMPNDVEMLSWSGYGVVVAGAHEEAKSVAKEVVPSVEEDGVAIWIEKYLQSIKNELL
ncbi:hypothetical protein HK098_000694 [Nowakowskiella sp. JEL0407]|nr:hypothetical protein HK098_000694 [Nowakowskiella sp. JEL0407]